jgi:GNAT superfamily N-acetyltransferase
MNLEIHPVTPDRLADLTRFSEGHGKFRYCSCMRWRLTSSEFQASTKESRVARLEQLVREGTPIGLLGYVDGEPLAWCSIAPRETYGAIERSRSIPRLDDAPVWGVVCFFVNSKQRGRRIRPKLLEAAIEYAHQHGASVVEGYPVEPGSVSYSYMGPPSMYEAAGFQEVARTTAKGATPRRLLRLTIGKTF